MEVKTISYGFKIKPKVIDVAMCITSRYCKGFSNYNPENAVIEVQNGAEKRNNKTGIYG